MLPFSMLNVPKLVELLQKLDKPKDTNVEKATNLPHSESIDVDQARSYGA